MRKHFLVTLPAVVLLSMLLCSPVQAELVHHWEFENDTDDSVGTWNGTGGIGFAPGMIGQAATFDGTAASDITFTFNTAGLKNITVAFWMKLDTAWTPGKAGIGRVMGSADNFECVLGPSGGGTGQVANNFFISGGTYPLSTTIPTPDTWYHVALTSSLSTAGGTARAEVWINGVMEAAQDNRAINDWTSGVFAFGQRPGAGGYRFPGLLDDVRIYNEVLSEEEIKAVMEGVPTKAHEPSPADGARGVPLDQVLSWKAGLDPADSNNPNPNIIEHYLWLSKPYSPMNPPAGPDWDDPAVQTFTIGADTDPADGNVDPNASKAVPGLQKDSLYFWAVDEGLTGSSGPLETDPAKIIWGDAWIFETETTGPQVDAGSSVVTWLKEGTTTVDVNGTVTDGTGDVTVIQWSVLTAPFGATVDIANTAVAATTATLTETGTYVLQLYARDATMLEDSGAIEIKVYNDGCEAAKNSPDGYTAPPYDFNGDCIENFNDFALFAARWLEDASLMSDLLYDAGDITLPVVQFTNPLDSSTVSGQVIINVIAYDPGVGATDGDGMEGAGIVRFQVFDSTGAVVGTQDENTAPFDMTWNTAAVDNGVYTIRVTAESDAGYIVIKEISVTVNNP